jgi:hypothetical protein
MKTFVTIAAIAALSACTPAADETPAATDTAMADTAMPAADTGVAPGTYDVKDADGKMGKTVINADGTYEDTGADGKVTKGAYARKDGKDCFDPEGDEAEMCWTVTPADASGMFSATTADGKTTVTVTPAAAAAMATPAPAAT